MEFIDALAFWALIAAICAIVANLLHIEHSTDLYRLFVLTLLAAIYSKLKECEYE